MHTNSVLVEVIESPVEILNEAKPDNGHRMVVRAKLMEADVRNANRRVYRKEIVKREVDRLQERIKSKLAFGSGDHPSDGRTTFDNVTHLWEKVWISGKEIFGQAVILNTERGRTLQEIVRAAKAVPVSARGVGTVRSGQWEGEAAEIVEDNYELVTFDFVLNNPGFEDAKAVALAEQETTREQTSAFVRYQQHLAGGDPGSVPIGPPTAVQRQEVLLAGLDVPMQKHAPAPAQDPPRRTLSEQEVRLRDQRRAGLADAATRYAAMTQLPSVVVLALRKKFPRTPIKLLTLGQDAVFIELVSQMGGQTLKVPFTIGIDGEAVLAEPERVVGEERERILSLLTEKKHDDSLGQIMSAVETAVRERFAGPPGEPPKAWPVDVYLDRVIVRANGTLFEIPYELSDTGEVKLGDGQQVQIQYVAV